MNGGDTQIEIIESKDKYNQLDIGIKLGDYRSTQTIENADETVQPSPKSNNSVNDSMSNEYSFSNLLARNKKLIVKVYGNDIKIKSPFQLGKVYSLCYIHNIPLIIIGPECKIIEIIKGIIACMVFLGMNGGFFLIITLAFEKLHVLLRILGLFLYLIYFLSHIYSLLINPGIPNRKNYITDDVIQVIAKNIDYNKNLLKNYRKCDLCNILVQAKRNVGHCDKCEICVEGMFFPII